jgi:hypothetical protein
MSVTSTRLGLTNEVLGELDMAVLQGINSAEVLCVGNVAAPTFTRSDLRVDVGMAPEQRSIRDSFWRMVADGVLRYKACSPVARWLLPRTAALVAVVLYWIIRLAPYWLNQ